MDDFTHCRFSNISKVTCMLVLVAAAVSGRGKGIRLVTVSLFRWNRVSVGVVEGKVRMQSISIYFSSSFL